uniref:Secreted protein n=1 Tax=Wuchereria bancrofti TaxID=6293 RepID=A0A1I8F0N0_WUCBA
MRYEIMKMAPLIWMLSFLPHLSLVDFSSTVQQQQESSHKNRTFIISDSQHCSVSATLSLGRPKKLFISKNVTDD